MHVRENAYLRRQIMRFMRPDAARYLRPDAARFLKPGTETASVYPALALKWDGQPQIPAGQDGAGQFTFGREDGGSGLPRVYITTTNGIGEGSGGNGSGNDYSGLDPGNDLDLFLLASAIPPGIGHNEGPSLEDPPQIPETKP